jgi:hypothetical protein
MRLSFWADVENEEGKKLKLRSHEQKEVSRKLKAQRKAQRRKDKRKAIDASATKPEPKSPEQP